MTNATPVFAAGHPTIRLGDLEIVRLGFGAMRLTGPEIWGEPEDPARARDVLRRVVALGMNFIDTSWYYGPHVANRLIAETLHPYPKDLVIATKLGAKRTPDKGWVPFARPEELREGCETDLRGLRRDVLDVVHFRHIGRHAKTPFRESLDAMIELKKEGKIRHLALSNVGITDLDDALARTPIVAVQNAYSVAGGAGIAAGLADVEAPERVLERCETKGIPFLPYFPLAMGALGKPSSALAAAAERHRTTPAQIAIAWLLARSPVMLPIPGTSRVDHLEENWNARTIALGQDEARELARAAAHAAAQKA